MVATGEGFENDEEGERGYPQISGRIKGTKGGKEWARNLGWD